MIDQKALHYIFLFNMSTRRIALVTGAGSGIGRAVALAFQSAGYSVVLAGRRGAELERTSAHAPRPNSAPYTATKHAITGLTKSISLDCRKYDIACGQIDIGNAATEMSERMKAGVPQANGTVLPEPRIDVRHVADAVLYM